MTKISRSKTMGDWSLISRVRFRTWSEAAHTIKTRTDTTTSLSPWTSTGWLNRSWRTQTKSNALSGSQTRTIGCQLVTAKTQPKQPSQSPINRSLVSKALQTTWTCTTSSAIQTITGTSTMTSQQGKPCVTKTHKTYWSTLSVLQITVPATTNH